MNMPTPTRRDCARAWEAMPWVLQQSATAEQAAWLGNHLAGCASCRAEYAQQQRLQQAMQLPSDVPVDANAGLKRLLDRLDVHDAETASAAKAPLRMRAGGWLVRGLVAAVLVQAVGIGILGLKLRQESGAAGYRTFSQAPAVPTQAGAIHVVPDAGMKVADWNALVHALHLQVVGGPNDVGAYTVVPADGAAARDSALRRLRATPGIRMAEPVADAP